MDQKQLEGFYEKLYFHELDSRQRLVSRLQLSFTILVALASSLGFLMQGYRHAEGFASQVFTGLLLVAGGAFLVGFVYFVFAVHGHSYAELPTAKKTEEHRLELEAHYKDEADGLRQAADRLRQVLLSYFVAGATHNAVLNEKRSLFLHHSNTALVVATPIVLLMFVTFVDTDGGVTYLRGPLSVGL